MSDTVQVDNSPGNKSYTGLCYLALMRIASLFIPLRKPSTAIQSVPVENEGMSGYRSTRSAPMLFDFQV